MHHGPAAEDRAAIDDLYSTYLWALDTRDEERYVATFFEDATLIEEPPAGPVTRGTGTDAVRAFVRAFWARHTPGHQHRETTRVYLPDPSAGPDRFAVRAYVFATHFDAATHTASAYWSGYYRDEVERRDGEWRFASRWIAGWQGDVLARYAGRQ